MTHVVVSYSSQPVRDIKVNTAVRLKVEQNQLVRVFA
jgi:hypothetical protein